MVLIRMPLLEISLVYWTIGIAGEVTGQLPNLQLITRIIVREGN